MNRDHLITEIPGISQAGVMALHNLGVNRITQLLAADYEQVAVVLDDFNEATRLLREARRILAEAANTATAATEGSPPAPAPSAGGGAGAPSRKSGTRHRAPAKTSGQTATPRPPSPAPTHTPAVTHASAPTTSIPTAPGPLSSQPEPRAVTSVARTPRPDEEAMGQALAHAARGLHFTSDSAADRLALARRLHAAATLLGHGAGAEDVTAALILEGVEQGAIQAGSVARTFGERAASLVDECATLRAVPVSPLGRLPKYYLEMAGRSSLAARRIGAAHQLAQLAFTEAAAPASGDTRGALWYARLLLQALEAGGPDPLVSALRAAVETADRIAA